MKLCATVYLNYACMFYVLQISNNIGLLLLRCEKYVKKITQETLFLWISA